MIEISTLIVRMAFSALLGIALAATATTTVPISEQNAHSIGVASYLVGPSRARGAGLSLYETGAPDRGTAGASQAALAADASTAGANPGARP
jgi:hypothetical protein